MDLIDRQAAIDAINEIDDGINMDISTNEVRELLRELPSAEPLNVQEAYYKGKIDAFDECVASLKRLNEEMNR